MALGPAPDGVEDVFRDRALGDGLELASDVGSAEPAEIHADGTRRPADLGHPGEDGVAGGEVVGATGQERHERLRRHVADEEGDQVTRGGIDPLDVLDHGQRRCGRAEPAEETEESLEQPGAVEP